MNQALSQVTAPANQAGASRGKSGAHTEEAPAAAPAAPSCPDGSTWNGIECAGTLQLTEEPSAGLHVPSSESGGGDLQVLTRENEHTTAPPPADTAPPMPTDLGTGVLAGIWAESFGSRNGCSDKVSIRQAASDLEVFGADCNDGERYRFETPTFTGNTLRVRSTVVSSGYVIQYTLRQTHAGELKGRAEVTGGGGTNGYDVTWTRESRGTGTAAAASTPPRGTASQTLDGIWVEAFGARSGCSDKVSIQQVGNALRLSGGDCNSGDPYIYSQITYNGLVLSLKVTMPNSKNTLHYTLHQTHPGELKGKAKVTSNGTTNSFDVTWTRRD